MLANQQDNLATLRKEAEAIKVRLETANSMIEKSRVELETLRAEREADAGANSKLQEQLATLSPELDTAQATWLEQSEQRFLVADLRPLTPEQLAWSIMTVTGTVENTKAAVRVELDKESPLTAEQQADAAQLEQRRRTIQKKVVEKLQPTVNVFVSLFGHGPGQPQDGFFATVDQSLFFANAGTVQGWIGQGGNSLFQRLRKLQSTDEVASELYLSVYGRAPSQDEIEFVGEYLAQAADQRDPVLRELIWALITSAEFRFNH